MEIAKYIYHPKNRFDGFFNTRKDVFTIKKLYSRILTGSGNLETSTAGKEAARGAATLESLYRRMREIP